MQFAEMIEEARKEGFAEGKKKGQKKSEKKGEKKFGLLISMLLEDGRVEDAKKACTNKKTRKKLYKYYSIS